MKRFVLFGLCLSPWLAGCASFTAEPIPPAPALVGIEAQNAALIQAVRQGRGDQPDVFVPLVEAEAAVEAARAQPRVNDYAAEMLAGARAELEQAKAAWAAGPGEDGWDAARLAEIAAHAHSAKRLAEIAQFTALREINLAKLIEADSQLRATQSGAAPDSAGQGTDLVGQQVVPDRFGAVAFEPGTARLTADSQRVITELSALLDRMPKYGVAILGHTDDSAPPEASLQAFVEANPSLKERDLSMEEKVYAYNLALSAARARAVAQALVDAGVAARRIGARGFGSSRPIASNDSASGRAANRRVIAVIVPGPDSADSPLARPQRGG